MTASGSAVQMKGLGSIATEHKAARHAGLVGSAANGSVISTLRAGCHLYLAPTFVCKRNIKMTPLCKIEVTHPRVLGSREVRRGGVVDEQAGVQSS